MGTLLAVWFNESNCIVDINRNIHNLQLYFILAHFDIIIFATSWLSSDFNRLLYEHNLQLHFQLFFTTKIAFYRVRFLLGHSTFNFSHSKLNFHWVQHLVVYLVYSCHFIQYRMIFWVFGIKFGILFFPSSHQDRKKKFLENDTLPWIAETMMEVRKWAAPEKIATLYMDKNRWMKLWNEQCGTWNGGNSSILPTTAHSPSEEWPKSTLWSGP